MHVSAAATAGRRARCWDWIIRKGFNEVGRVVAYNLRRKEIVSFAWFLKRVSKKGGSWGGVMCRAFLIYNTENTASRQMTGTFS